MTIKETVERLAKNRKAVQEHENAINEIIRDSLETVRYINHDLIQIADQGYDYDNGEWNMDEDRTGDDSLTRKIEGLDLCLHALTETLNRMKIIKDSLDVEGEF